MTAANDNAEAASFTLEAEPISSRLMSQVKSGQVWSDQVKASGPRR